MNTLPVSLIMTVWNEARSLPVVLESVLRGTALPAEIVIVDGGSTDGTQEIAQQYMEKLPIRLIEKPGANISEGRNAAISAAQHSIIAATDAGVRLSERWLEELVAPFGAHPGSGSAPAVVSGFFLPDVDTPFERAMGATVLPALEDINPETFLPSSRSVAFLKEVWAAAGGYPEWLDYCEDLVFDLALRDQGFKFAFAPGAIAYFRPRSTLKSFYVQYYRYARGDGKADLWRKRYAVRYATYLLGPAMLSWALRHSSSATGKLVLLAIALAGAAYCQRPYARLLPMLRSLSTVLALKAIAFVPVIRVTGDLAKMAGYPVGVVWRWRHKHK